MTGITEIRAAAVRAEGIVRRTPLLTAPLLNAELGRRIWVKAECLQLTGSFKFRGAWSALSALEPEARAKGVIAYSSGNHAQGVAHAAALHGVPAVIVMPSDAPRMKIENTRAYGAEVVLYDRVREAREEIGAALAAERGLTLIKPYDDPMVIAGQGTCGLEIAEQAREAGIERADVLVCCGGGGLTSGIALALEADAPHLRVRPVEPEGFDDTKRSLETGQRETNPAMAGSICDAIVTPSPGALTFPVMQRLCGPGVSVSDAQALHAMKLAWQHFKIIIEPGGAVALAAALFFAEFAGADVIAVATGGNVDESRFLQALEARI